jgi:putative endonuclease
MRGGWTYIMTNHAYGVLYVGVTADLAARIARHRSGKGSSFCRKYRLHRLVLAEHHDSIDDAIRRETLLKTLQRPWKIELIEAANPAWRDLWDDING